MGAAPQLATYGTFRFIDPDLSVPAKERATFAGPAPKTVKEETIQLHDFRTSNDVAKGGRGLDVQAFTYVNHVSSLTGDEMLHGSNAEDIYVPEIIDLVLKVTGASRAIAHNVAFRRKLSTKQVDLYNVQRRGNDMDEAVKKQRFDRIIGKQLELFQGCLGRLSFAAVQGRDDDANEPARHAHCDMVLESLRDTIHVCRQDICEMAKPSVDAELARAGGENVRVPRYAAYSVWV